MKKILLLNIFLLSSIGLYAIKDKHCVLWSLPSLVSTNTVAVNRIISNADKIVTEDPISVVQRKKNVTNDLHNYESMAIYAWVDTVNGKESYIIKDGQRNPESNNYCGPLINKLSNNLSNLGQAYYITGDERYAYYALKQLNTWFIDDVTYMKPDMEYGQFYPTQVSRKGNPGAISEAYFLLDAIEMIALLKDNKKLDKKTDKKLKVWFNDFATWLKDSDIGKRMQAANDNCGNMYDILLYRINLYLNNSKECKRIENSFTEQRLLGHIAEDGRQTEELKRTKAMMYSIYNLRHIIDFCYMLEKSGTHYYSQNHERIDAAMAFLYQYMGKKEEFPYKEIGDWKSIEKELEREYSRLEKLKQHNL